MEKISQMSVDARKRSRPSVGGKNRRKDVRKIEFYLSCYVQYLRSYKKIKG